MSTHRIAKMWTRYVALPCLALLAVAAVAVAAQRPHDVTAANAPRVCFPVKRWSPAPRRFAPCVRVTRVYEDGSFSYAVSDKDGTVRYTAGIGALDR